MSYVDKNDEEKIEEAKSEGVIKAMFVDSTVVESPEDVIEKDTDINRKNAFKRAYDRLLTLLPEVKDKKKKKAKEKEEFDRNLNVRGKGQVTQTKSVSREEKTIDDERTKGIER